MMKQTDLNNWQIAIERLSDRLRTPLNWYPTPALISVGLVLILTGHLLPGLNSRQGNKADVISFDAKKEEEGAIWIGMYPEDGVLNIITSDKTHFKWPLSEIAPTDITDFSSYLKSKVKQESIALGRSLDANIIKTSAVLAVDQKLQYRHIRPVLIALAEAKISKYAFETKILR